MVSDVFSIETTANSLGVDVSTVYRYLKSYVSVGLKDFLSTNYVGYSGKLTEAEIVILIAELKSKLYTTAKSVSAFIYDTFGVKYSVSGTADLLYRIGFVFKKITGISCECDIAKQKKFVSKMSKIFKTQDADTVI
jgi:transposase